MNYQRPKGTADILPGQSERWQQVEAVARKILPNTSTAKSAPRFLKMLMFFRAVPAIPVIL